MTRIAQAGVLTAFVAAIASVDIASAGSPSTRPASPGRYSVESIVLPGGLGTTVSVTDHQDGMLYYYKLEGEALVLFATFDLSAAGQPTIKRVHAEPPEPAKPASAPATAPARPAEQPTLSVRLDRDGTLRSLQGYTLAAADLPAFAKEAAAGRMVVVHHSGDINLSQLIEARDRLRNAGMQSATFLGAPDDPEERHASIVSLALQDGGGFRLKYGLLLPDKAVPLFIKEMIGNRAVEVKPAEARSVTLTQLVQARDRLKAAGIEHVMFAGQATEADK